MEQGLVNNTFTGESESIAEYLRFVNGSPLTYPTLGDMPYHVAHGFEFLLSAYGRKPISIFER
jgi:hypothetical protein